MRRDRLTDRLRAQIQTDDTLNALLGDGAGRVWANESRRICYIRLNGIQSQLARAINNTGVVVHGSWVAVRRVQHMAVPHVVVGPAGGVMHTTGPYSTTVEPHGITHEQAGYPGPDPVDIYPTAITTLRAQPTDPESLYVDIHPGMIYMTSLVWYAGERVGPFVQPSSGQRCDLLYLTAAGVATIVQGTQTWGGGALWPPGPDPDAGTKPIAWILVRASEAKIGWEHIKPLHYLSPGLGMADPAGPSQFEEQIGWFGYPLYRIGPETPIGDVDGTNDTFITAHMLEPDTVEVWLNGILQAPLIDYEELGSRAGLVFRSPPCATSEVLVSYMSEMVIR